MAILTKAPRGTQDVLPAQSYKWREMERMFMETAQLFGFREIRFPVFEHTELFNRSVGDTTDVVQKEMYTFEDKGGRSLTLRPEGTAGALRAVLENGLLNEILPLKVSYLANCFRYEKPQAGRLREFHQFGVEMLGAADPASDAQMIALARTLLDNLQLRRQVQLEINSIGCPECRAHYQQALHKYLSAHSDGLCDTCKQRLEKNPMRIFDCKNLECATIAGNAPTILEYLCKDCDDHFEELQKHLKATKINFCVNPKIVRGLDYYTRTVFEFVSSDIGAQGTVCGGGRYDGLVELLGGPPTPAIGFAMGLERLLMILEKRKRKSVFQAPKPCNLYIGSTGKLTQRRSEQLCMALRAVGLQVESDTMGRSVKAQMKYANKLGAQFSCILGEEEVAKKLIEVRRMEDGKIFEVPLTDLAISRFLYCTHNWEDGRQDRGGDED